MKAYKSFDENLCCNSYGKQQYVVGETYTCEEAKLCKCGFHACTNPNDVLDYYQDRFCEVELEGVNNERDYDSKVCGTKITILRELTLAEYHAICFEYNSKLKLEAQASGDFEYAQASGPYGHAQASGYNGKAQASGDYGHAQASGNYGRAQASGYYGRAQASGTYGRAQASGTYGHAQASGNYGHAQTSGANSVACSLGINGTAKSSHPQSAAIMAKYDDRNNLIGFDIVFGTGQKEIVRMKGHENE